MNGGNSHSPGLFLPYTKRRQCIGLVINQYSSLIQLSDISVKGAKLLTPTFDRIQQIKSQIQCPDIYYNLDVSQKQNLLPHAKSKRILTISSFFHVMMA